MIPLPPSPASGFPILDWARAAQETLRRLRVSAGPGIRLVESSGGIIVSAAPNGTSSVAEDYLPWDIILTGVGDPVTSYKAKVWPGVVAGAMPGNMFAEFTGIPTTGAKYLVATVTTDGRGALSTLLSFESSAAAPPAPELGSAASEVAVNLGVVVEGVAYNLWGRNVNVQSREVFREDKPSAGPHELPYQSWWGWSVT